MCVSVCVCCVCVCVCVCMYVCMCECTEEQKKKPKTIGIKKLSTNLGTAEENSDICTRVLHRKLAKVTLPHRTAEVHLVLERAARLVIAHDHVAIWVFDYFGVCESEKLERK